LLSAAPSGAVALSNSFITAASDRNARVYADPERLRSVFENLIRNALESGGTREATGAGIGISGSSVTITVFDRGRGIAAEDLKRVFDPFFTRKSSGTGIGLSICRRFAEAAAAFDTAFILKANLVYRNTYQPDRERAWELRNTDTAAGSKAAAIVDRESLNWGDLIELTKSETDLLRFLTAGRDWPAAELFTRLLERSFIPYTQDVTANEWPHTKPRLDEQVSRAGVSWFLWHLYAENRADRGLLTRYSARYAARQNPRSPIADLPILSPFFDSILGCVESEFMALPDGRNFIPAGPVRGAELLAILKKIQ
jgi:hypothetical protein